MCWPALLLALLSFNWQQCSAHKREVFSCRELREALADGGVRHIVAMQAGSFNCSAHDLPVDMPLTLVGREVLLEGQGPGLVYFDYNVVKGMHVLVSHGARLMVRNVWLDHCLADDLLALCISSVLEGGWIDIADSRLSDIACVNARRSKAIQEVENRMQFTTGAKAGVGRDVDARTIYIKDSGWLSGAVHNSNWRLANLTLTCTGNMTHPLPDDFVDVEMWYLSPVLLVAGGVTFLVLIAGLLWFYTTKGNARTPEYLIADSRGFRLEATLGKGHFGRVYRGRRKTDGQLVAVKVIDLLPSQSGQVVAAYRECQLLSSVQHDSIVRVLTFYTAQVQRTQRAVEIIQDGRYGHEYVAVDYRVIPRAGSSAASAPASGSSGQPGSGASIFLANPQPGEDLGGSEALAGTPPQGSQEGPGSGSASGSNQLSDMEGVHSIQVQLVTQYCDMGTLERSVKTGFFNDASTGRPRLRHILLTALDIAQGLEYLHHSSRRMVHRDLSANNILLTTSSSDDRGFRAMLSDFGLSTVLSPDQTHKTSQVKGTISYMNPELFLRDDVSPALDIYSLGIILHSMYSGKEPFKGMSTAMIILAKVRNQTGLQQLDGCPETFQKLVRDCTQYERRNRPTAAKLVQRLEILIMNRE